MEAPPIPYTRAQRHIQHSSSDSLDSASQITWRHAHMPEQPLPSEDEVRGYLESCKNWGRWGPDDSAGTVNHITPETRVKAASLVKTGRAVSAAYPLNTVGGPGNWNPAQH